VEVDTNTDIQDIDGDIARHVVTFGERLSICKMSMNADANLNIWGRWWPYTSASRKEGEQFRCCCTVSNFSHRKKARIDIVNYLVESRLASRKVCFQVEPHICQFVNAFSVSTHS
jgi:hypothetical protein